MTANKALLAAIFAAAASVVADLRGADDTLNFQDWVVTILAALAAGGVVWLVPNRRGRETGQTTPLVNILIAVLLVLLIIWLASAVF